MSCRDFFPPPLRWWITPSGGDVAPPRPWSVWDYWMESPLGAHLTGAAIAFGLGWLAVRYLPLQWAAFGYAAVWAGVGQAQKADALFPLGRYTWREVIWRCVIGVVPLAVVLGVLDALA